MKATFLFFTLGLTSCINFSLSHESALAEFDGLPVKPLFDSLRIDERTIHYSFINQGKDTLVAFVHGSPGSWSAFIDFFKADTVLSTMDMVAIDRPGFGNSDFGKPEPSIEIQAQQIHEVVVSFSHPVKILVGHSLGGPVVARMAMDYPTSYSRLVLVAPSIDPDMEKDEWYRGVIASRAGRWMTPEDIWVSNEEILPLKTELQNMLDCWQFIRSEVIVIQGTKDSLVPKENADFASTVLSDSILEVRLLEGVDHFIPWTHPQEIIKALY